MLTAANANAQAAAQAVADAQAQLAAITAAYTQAMQAAQPPPPPPPPAPQAIQAPLPALPPAPAPRERFELGRQREHAFIFENAQQADAHGEALAPPPAAPPVVVLARQAEAAPADPVVLQQIAPMFQLGRVEDIAMPAAGIAAAADAGAAAAARRQPFVLPPVETVAAAPSRNAHLCPHGKVPAVIEPEPTGPADLLNTTTAKVQPCTGEFDFLVMAEPTLLENCHADSRKVFDQHRAQLLYVVHHNGGSFHNENLPDVLDIVREGISGHCNLATTTVFAVAAADKNYGKAPGVSARCAPPFITGVIEAAPLCPPGRVTSWALLAPEDCAIPWIANILSTSIGAGTPEAELALRTAYIQIVRVHVAFGVMLNQVTWANDKCTLDERRHKLSETIQVVWNERLKAYIIYMQPCTSDVGLWRKLVSILCGQELRYSFYIFKSLIDPTKNNLGPRCVLCKNDDHFASTCTLTQDKDWWGPQSQLSGITEGPLAPKSNRGRGRGNRGGNRGDGGHARGGFGRGHTSAIQTPPPSHAMSENEASKTFGKWYTRLWGRKKTCTTDTQPEPATFTDRAVTSSAGGSGSSATGTRLPNEGCSSGGDRAGGRPETNRINHQTHYGNSKCSEYSEHRNAEPRVEADHASDRPTSISRQ
ncbi:hypothetical protein B0H16DRAFT_1462709 [Mycena metata]|uniref:Uncharacterized protein n=1 Tax=Mycena metata TaxID=1033252 RepID=A0AAD7N4W3_9AGAR|nr:hypothetical protein B0H16DRAFT_1462709 [Mycena metata]